MNKRSTTKPQLPHPAATLLRAVHEAMAEATRRQRLDRARAAKRRVRR
jgi:hypothetical protein